LSHQDDVITGLVPVISIRRTPRLSDRDGRDKPGHDTVRLARRQAWLAATPSIL
jgi:hypothetical protein